jgi:hypothetical protein
VDLGRLWLQRPLVRAIEFLQREQTCRLTAEGTRPGSLIVSSIPGDSGQLGRSPASAQQST